MSDDQHNDPQRADLLAALTWSLGEDINPDLLALAADDILATAPRDSFGKIDPARRADQFGRSALGQNLKTSPQAKIGHTPAAASDPEPGPDATPQAWMEWARRNGRS